jgi:hypothetical protein
VSGKLNNAVQFDGTSDFIQVAGNTSLRPPSTLAVSAHIKTASAPSEADIVSMGDNYTLRIKADGNVTFSYHTGSLMWTTLTTTGVNVLNNTFHHVVGQKTPDKIEIYVDGVLKNWLSTNGAPIAYTLGPNLIIGKHGNGGTRYFNGLIDEVKIYNHNLDATQIANLASILRTDKNTPIPISTLNPPAAKGQKITEQNFDVQILRATDQSDGAQGCQTGNSYWPSFNVNNTRILFICKDSNGADAVWYKNFDPNTQTVSEPKALVVNSSQTNEMDDVLWSAENPEYVVYHQGPTLFWKNVVTGNSGTEKSFTSIQMGGDNRVLWQMSRSENNDVWAFTKALSTSPSMYTSHVGYIVWRRSTNTILLNEEFTQTGGWDEVHIDKTGRYLFVSKGAFSSGAIGGWVKDLQAVPITTTTISYSPEQRAPGHYAMGQGTLVGTNDWDNPDPGPGVLVRSLATPQSWTSIIDYQNVYGRSVHFSMLADNQAWVLNSTYRNPGSGSTAHFCDNGQACSLQNEIFQIATDGSQKVRRITHHHSVDMNLNFFNTPRANISEDGRFVAFTSNWPQGGVPRRDVYVAIIPPAP